MNRITQPTLPGRKTFTFSTSWLLLRISADSDVSIRLTATTCSHTRQSWRIPSFIPVSLPPLVTSLGKQFTRSFEDITFRNAKRSCRLMNAISGMYIAENESHTCNENGFWHHLKENESEWTNSKTYYEMRSSSP